MLNKYGKFIHIVNKNDESYYHIYFNDNKEETNKNNLTEDDKITKIIIIIIIIDYQVKSFYRIFFYCLCIESINFK